jgi:hypothetical protein
MGGKYKRIEVNTVCVDQLLREIETDPNSQYNEAPVALFTQGDIEHAINAGGRKKAPGRDGLSSEFYKHIWEITREKMVEIFNQTFWDGHITPRPKQGEIICVTKRRSTNEPRDYRPITLLKTDYKILARIFAQRLRPVLAKHLQDTQFCGVPGNSILDAAATITYIIAFAETERVPLCVRPTDFNNAFDNISHKYLFQTLKRYGICDSFIRGIMNMYEGASSFVKINGHSYGPMPIQCGIRHVCPMSMVLYALCLQPFLNFLNRKMAGINIGNKMSSTAVVAYADDVTIFVTDAAELTIVEEAITLFGKASGALLNPQKSKAPATRGWKTTYTIRGIEYYHRPQY